MRKGILIQSRLTSTRFSAKMLQLIDGIPLVEYVYNRCRLSKSIGIVSVITSIEPSDDELYNYCTTHTIPVFRGSLNDVLKRYIDAADFYNLDYIVRVCGDSPFVDFQVIDSMVAMIVENKFDYCCYDSTQTFPGFISEVISRNALKMAADKAIESEDREHVTRYIRNHLTEFKVHSLSFQTPGYQDTMPKLTIDYPGDLEFINKIILGKGVTSDTPSKKIAELIVDDHKRKKSQ